MSPSPQLEILDLRHFSAAQLKPLLRDEADLWQRRLHWDYSRSSALLLEYLDSRILPGFVALQAGRIVGYAFCVFEGAKAVIGDIYAFGETESTVNPICDTLLHHLLELLLATPGIDRIESQLLLFPAGSLTEPFRARNFRSFPRLFMMRNLKVPHDTPSSPAAPRPPDLEPSVDLTLQPWRPEFYDAAATLIHRCYSGHMDAEVNDQYRTLHGAQRFLHNIIRFPGCGVFDPDNSWALRSDSASGNHNNGSDSNGNDKNGNDKNGNDKDANSANGRGAPEFFSQRHPHPHLHPIEAILLCSRVRSGVDHITQLCVTPSLRGHHLGEALLEHCAAESARRGVQSLSLTVTEANAAALHLYQRNGFTTLHRFEATVWDANRPA